MQYDDKNSAVLKGSDNFQSNNNIITESETFVQVDRDTPISLIPLWEHVVRTNTLPGKIILHFKLQSRFNYTK